MALNKTLGSMLIIAGTTIGAGMLALPLASAGLGFTTALIAMFGMWALMTYTALLMIEIHQHAETDATLNTLAQQLLGRKGQIIANFAMMFLLYSLCAAYIAGGGGQLSEKLSDWLSVSIPPQLGALLFTLLIAGVVSIGTHTVDLVNRILFTAKIVALAVMLGLLVPHVEGQHLVEMPVQKGLILSALPVVFTSFGFHGSIPSIVRYVGIDVKTLKKVMILGSALPLFIYLLWQLASQGVMSQPELMASTTLGAFIASLSELLHNPMVSKSVSIFADLALATSFLGVSLGLFDFMADSLKRASNVTGRLQTGLITFLPPLAFAIFYPQGFIMALGYAAIALVILAIFLPVAMVRSQRKKHQADNIMPSYMVRGGNLALAIVTLAGVLIISAQTMQMVGIIPAVG
ncbi:tyrosine transporter TyrP [Photobacterium lucens]|uniref:tyrosine transporter TyrP n=1 Tax=Photobacterium lucens TaxID=2562949 RepID=UPI00136D59C2|nr:tyrosine transporter TyrP [Photobacterium lucens]MBP2700624.1 tyrosine transporter TyrP [Vibrio parahaemolyticus]MZG57838.1 tyrosine transporter TyrP [Photobacterium lucens]MZG82916.1 tyrosine transporter TyrP [Photobacterium lucens]